MNKQEVLNEYKRQEDKICLAQILDKIEFSNSRGKLETTDFLDMYQISLVENFLRKIKFENYILYGAHNEAERKILIIYSDKYNMNMVEKNYNKLLRIIRITLPEEDKGKYTHRNYLGGIIKLGIKREKVGDILVFENGADIIVTNEIAEILKKELHSLTRFETANIQVWDISSLRKQEIHIEEFKIIVPSLRLDNIVSDLAKTSRSKAVQIIDSERVFINGQCETKVSKQVKIKDIITIRGKGRFVIKEISGTTRSGRPVLVIEKYV